MRSSRRHEHRSLVQLAAGLTVCSRCAIPREMVTTERIERATASFAPHGACRAHVVTSVFASNVSRPPVVSLLFVEC